MILLELTDEDALLFREYRKNYDTFSTLLSTGVFDIRGGSATLHFDVNGTLSNVDASMPFYKRGSKQLNTLYVIPN